MATESLATIPWATLLVKGGVAAAFFTAIAVGVVKGIGYLSRRWIERDKDTEALTRLHSAADLREKLGRQQISVEELKQFHSQALERPAASAVASAEYYIHKAQHLTRELDIDEEVWPEAITQADMNEQAAERFQRVDDELTSLIVRRMSTLDEHDAAALQTAQDAWTTWRDAEAHWESKTWEGGSIRPLMVASKLEALTRERIASLGASDELAGPALEIPMRRTPRDLMEHIEPCVSGERVRELLGTPHYITGERWYYRYLETQVEIELDGEVVKEVVVALVEGQTYSASLAGYEEFCFGELSFADLLELDPELEIKYQFSVRTIEVYALLRLGPPGAWSEYYFGALSVCGGGQLLESNFEWDENRQRLVTNPSEVLINWFGRTNEFDRVPAFSWHIR